MGGPWPIKPAIDSKPSAVSLKVRLRETSGGVATCQKKKDTVYMLPHMLSEITDESEIHYPHQKKKVSSPV